MPGVTALARAYVALRYGDDVFGDVIPGNGVRGRAGVITGRARRSCRPAGQRIKALRLVFTPVVAVRQIARAGNAFFFCRPFAKIDKLAALTAKRAKRTALIPRDCFAAARTVNYHSFRHMLSLTASQFKIETIGDLTIFTIQRQKADREAAFMP